MSADFVPVQTSVPDWMMTYCRQLADVYYGRKLNRMYVHTLEWFLEVQPWKANPPLEWRVARNHAARRTAAEEGVDPGWVPMNMQLPTELYNRIVAAIEIAEANGFAAKLSRPLSIRTFLFTAMCWWVIYVYPYEGPGLIDTDDQRTARYRA